MIPVFRDGELRHWEFRGYDGSIASITKTSRDGEELEAWLADYENCGSVDGSNAGSVTAIGCYRVGGIVSGRVLACKSGSGVRLIAVSYDGIVQDPYEGLWEECEVTTDTPSGTLAKQIGVLTVDEEGCFVDFVDNDGDDQSFLLCKVCHVDQDPGAACTTVTLDCGTQYLFSDDVFTEGVSSFVDAWKGCGCTDSSSQIKANISTAALVECRLTYTTTTDSTARVLDLRSAECFEDESCVNFVLPDDTVVGFYLADFPVDGVTTETLIACCQQETSVEVSSEQGKLPLAPLMWRHRAVFSHVDTNTDGNVGDGTAEHVLFDIDAGQSAYWGGTLSIDEGSCRGLTITAVYLDQSDACSDPAVAALTEVTRVFELYPGECEIDLPKGWLVELRVQAVDVNGVASSVADGCDMDIRFCSILEQCCDAQVAI